MVSGALEASHALTEVLNEEGLSLRELSLGEAEEVVIDAVIEDLKGLVHFLDDDEVFGVDGEEGFHRDFESGSVHACDSPDLFDDGDNGHFRGIEEGVVEEALLHSVFFEGANLLDKAGIAPGEGEDEEGGAELDDGVCVGGLANEVVAEHGHGVFVEAKEEAGEEGAEDVEDEVSEGHALGAEVATEGAEGGGDAGADVGAEEAWEEVVEGREEVLGAEREADGEGGAAALDDGGEEAPEDDAEDESGDAGRADPGDGVFEGAGAVERVNIFEG